MFFGHVVGMGVPILQYVREKSERGLRTLIASGGAV